MRGRTALIIIAVGIALALLIVAIPKPRFHTAAGEARPSEHSAPPTAATPAPAPDAPEEAPSDAQNPTAADDTLRPEPQHTGVEPDGSFNRGMLLIGDSLTAGLVISMRAHGTLGDARYIGIPSYSLQSFYSEPYFVEDDTAAGLHVECSWEFNGLSFAGAARQAGESVEAIYFMLGTNPSNYMNVENYKRTLRYLCDSCPNATVYAQTIPYSRSAYADYELVNSIVYESVTQLNQEGNDRVFVLDTYSAIGTEHNIFDGIHLDDEGLVLWHDFIVDHALNRN